MQKFNWKDVKGDVCIQYDQLSDAFTIALGNITVEGVPIDIMRKLEDDYDEAWLNKMMKKDYKNTFEALKD